MVEQRRTVASSTAPDTHETGEESAAAAAFWGGAKDAYEQAEATHKAAFEAQETMEITEFEQAFPGLKGTPVRRESTPTWTIPFEGHPLTVRKDGATGWILSYQRQRATVLAADGHVGLYSAALQVTGEKSGAIETPEE